MGAVTSSDEFVFTDRWVVDASPSLVFVALADVDGYPRWWPEVRQVQRVDDSRGIATIRSVLPVSLRLEMAREVEDAGTGELRVRISGDLVGFAEFTVTAEGGGTRADYHQEVHVAAAHLRLGARLAPVVLRANHERMMRGGEAGLRRLLSRR